MRVHRHIELLETAGEYLMPYVQTFNGESTAEIWKAGIGVPPVAITTQADGYDLYPQLSPDGATVAFLRLDFSGTFAFRYQLCTVPFAGGSVTTCDASTSYYCHPMMWHPDGSLLLYTVDPTSGSNTIHTVEPDGTNKSAALRTAPASNSIGRPKWNRDGSLIAYVQTDGTPDVRKMNADGSGDALVIAASSGASSITAMGLAWAKTADVIAYQFGAGVNSRPFKVNPDGTGNTELVAGASEPDRPVWDHSAWSTDDSELFVAKGGGAPWRLYSVDTSGGGSNTSLLFPIRADDGSWPIQRNGRLYMIRDTADPLSGGPFEFISTDLTGGDIEVLDDGSTPSSSPQLLFLDDY